MEEREPLLPKRSAGADQQSLRFNVNHTLNYPLIHSAKHVLAETWDYVFLPSVLGFWGILVYARYGYIVSKIGIAGVLTLISVTYTLIGLTTSSIAAICSNGACHGSGPYYLISRSLGPEFGGSIGVLRVLGNIVTVLLSLTAMSEMLQQYLAVERLYVATAINIAMTGVCLLQKRYMGHYNRAFALWIIAASGWTVASILKRKDLTLDQQAGWKAANLAENWWPEQVPSFQTMAHCLALFFPCSSGLLSGTSALHKLRVPGTSVSRGLTCSLIATLFLYCATTIFFAGCFRRLELVEDSSILMSVAHTPVILSMGALALQSALNSMASAAAMVQNMVTDDVFGCKFRARNRHAVVLCAVLVQLSLLSSKSLESAALLVTMSTLITFSAINLACFLLKVASAPNFRPLATWFSWKTAVSGFALSFLLMFALSVTYALVSLIIFAAIFVAFHYTATPQNWGDVTQALIYHQVRKYLLQLNGKPHVKLWRPQILLLVKSPASAYTLIKFINDLKKGALFVVGHAVLRNFREWAPFYERDMQAWSRLFQECGVKAFPQIVINENFRQACQQLFTAVGLGGLRPNMVILSHSANSKRGKSLTIHQVANEALVDPLYEFLPHSNQGSRISSTDFVGVIEDVLAINKAVGVARGFENLTFTHSIPERKSTASFRQTLRHQSDAKRRLQRKLFDMVDGRSARAWSPLMDARAQFPTKLKQGGLHLEVNTPKLYIDVWPINYADSTHSCDNPTAWMSSSVGADTLALQLGCILHMVPFWRAQFRLRVLTFVENLKHAHLEYVNVKSILEALRINAQIKVVCLDGTSSGSISDTVIDGIDDRECDEQGVWLADNFYVSCNGSATFTSENAHRCCKESSRGGLKDSNTELTSPNSSERSTSSQQTVVKSECGLNEADSDLTPCSAKRDSPPQKTFKRLPLQTRLAVVNDLMQKYSNAFETKLCITTLPLPEAGSSNSVQKAEEYVTQLNILSNNLVPTLFVHGVDDSVSRSL